MKRHLTGLLAPAMSLAAAGAFLTGLIAGLVTRPAPERDEIESAAATSDTRFVAPAPRPALDPEVIALVPAARVDAPPPRLIADEPRIRPFAVPRIPPLPPPAAAPVAGAPVAAAPARVDPLDRLAAVHALALRIDLRSGDELERELLIVPELDLDNRATPFLAAQLVTAARASQRAGQPEPPVVLACKVRPDLAGLPFRVGVEAVLPEERADALHRLSRHLRRTYESMLVRPDPTVGRFYGVLTAERGPWAMPEAVPCIQQILLAENETVRRMSCELLRELRTGDATVALAQVAVFDPEPANRAAAVSALRERDEAEVVPLLVPFLRYPWVPAVEHACETLIALKSKTAIPSLAASFDLPDPDASFRIALPGGVGGSFRRELVRVNHARNCLMCHNSSQHQSEPLRAYAPVSTPEIPAQTIQLSPRMTGGYYNAPPRQVSVPGKTVVRSPKPNFVSATTTYLRQDFSLDQPVTNPGLWPARQRYDYFLRVSPGAGGPPLRKPEESPYRKAIGLAIRHLSDRDPARDKDWLSEQKAKAPVIEDLAGAVARVMLLTSYPNALLAVTDADIADKIMRGKPEEVKNAVEWLQKVHGPTAARLALIAYLDPLARSPVKAIADRSGRLFEIARGPVPDSALAKAIKDALAD